MASTATEDAVPGGRVTRIDSGAEKPGSRARRSGARSAEEDIGFTRYFLATANATSGILGLHREVASEGEALVESLRLGLTYYAVQEFRAVPDFAGRRPQLKREAVHGQ